MQHVVLRIEHIITDKLYRLRIYNRQMFILHHGVRKMLVHEFTKRPPLVAVMHHKQVVALGDKIVRDERGRPVVIEGAFLVNCLFDDTPVCDYSHGPVTDFQRVQAAVLLGPFREPEEWGVFSRR